MTKDDEILLTNWMTSLFSPAHSVNFPRRVIGRHAYVLPDHVLVAEQHRDRAGFVIKVQFTRVTKGKVVDLDDKCLIELTSRYISAWTAPVVREFNVFTARGLSQDEALNRIKSGLMKQKLATA